MHQDTHETIFKEFQLYQPAMASHAVEYRPFNKTSIIVMLDDGREVCYSMIGQITFYGTYMHDESEKDYLHRKAGSKLNFIMRSMGYTQSDLEYMSGISQQSVSKYTSGHGFTTLVNLNEIVKVLGCTLDDLITNESEFVDDDIENGIGARITDLMSFKDLTQKELSSLTGVSQQAISKYKRGLGLTPVISLYKIVKALNCTLDDLLV